MLFMSFHQVILNVIFWKVLKLIFLIIITATMM